HHLLGFAVYGSPDRHVSFCRLTSGLFFHRSPESHRSGVFRLSQPLSAGAVDLCRSRRKRFDWGPRDLSARRRRLSLSHDRDGQASPRTVPCVFLGPPTTTRGTPLE